MLILRRAFKNMWRRGFRTLLVSLVLALCVAVFISTIAGVDASEAAAADMMEQYSQAAEATIEETELWMRAMIVTGGTGPFSPEPIDEDMVDEVLSMDDVEAVVPMVMVGFGGPGGRFGRNFDYIIHGVPLDPELDEKYHALPVNILYGRSLEEGEDDAVLISDELTNHFEAGVGDIIDIEGTPFEVVGVYSSGLWKRDIYMSLSTSQYLLAMGDNVSMLAVYADSTSAVGDVADEIESEYPGYMVIALSNVQTQFGDVIQQQQGKMLENVGIGLHTIQNLGLRIILVSGIIAILLIFGLMFYTVRERTKEIGTLKALGFSNPDIMKQFMYEGLYIGLIGGAIGLAVASVAASLFSSWLLSPSETLNVSVGITLGSMLLGLGLAVIAGALGSLYPAWRASRVSPMEALRHE
jgi:putative ABC transport system permease protein